MARILLINSVTNRSTGTITRQIQDHIIASGWESMIAYGRLKAVGDIEHTIRIGNTADVIRHVLYTRLFDSHGLASARATRHFLNEINKFNPDLIHLHNIHGYYVNYPILFDFLRAWGGPVVWTLHDCWAFTGHCAHFQNIGCTKWIQGCHACTEKKEYPKSIFIDGSRRNYQKKKNAFQSVDNMTIVTPSVWLKDQVKSSFLSKFPCRVIHNGIDTEVFSAHNVDAPEKGKSIILAVASVWTESKGLGDLEKLAAILPENWHVYAVGLTPKQINVLPSKITGIMRTENQKSLARLYSQASVFVNPTYGDTFPTTNLEALACGTPVATYRTGGSPEAIDSLTGRVVERGDVRALGDAIVELMAIPPKKIAKDCRERAVRLFDQRDRFAEYIDLYNSLLGN